MMMRTPLTPITMICATMLSAAMVHAQPVLDRTRLVDGSGQAGAFTTIQLAIDDIGNQSGQWTVLIYAGVYDEAVTLDTDAANIDLVGVDGDAVFIEPPENTDAITIDGSTFGGVRNNAIRNLVIKTNDGSTDEGRAIVVKGSASMSSLVFDSLVIETTGAGSKAIDVESDVSEVTISNCTIKTTAASSGAVHFDGTVDDLSLSSTAVSTAGSSSDGVHFDDTVDGLTVEVTTVSTTGNTSDAIQGDLSLKNATFEQLTAKTTGTDSDGVDFTVSHVEDTVLSRCDITTTDGHGFVAGKTTGPQGDGSDRITIDSTSFDCGGDTNRCVLIESATITAEATDIAIMGSQFKVTGDNANCIRIGDAARGVHVVSCEFLSDGCQADTIVFEGVASDVEIIGTNVLTTKFTTPVVRGPSVDGALIRDCDFLTGDGKPVVDLGDDTTIINSRLIIASVYDTTGPNECIGVPGPDAQAIILEDGQTGWFVKDCVLQGTLHAMIIKVDGASDCRFEGCRFVGVNDGVNLKDCHDLEFDNCSFLADPTLFALVNVSNPICGLNVNAESGASMTGLKFTSCTFHATTVNAAADSAGAQVDLTHEVVSPDDSVQFIDCTFLGHATTVGRDPLGVVGKDDKAVSLIATKASAATAYTIDGSVGSVDPTYATIDPGDITANDSYEFTVLSSQ